MLRHTRSHARARVGPRCVKSHSRLSITGPSCSLLPTAHDSNKGRARAAATDAPSTPAEEARPLRLAADQQLLKGKRVVVVGGGMAGMMAAMSVARHGASVQVFEMRPRNFSTGPNTWVIALSGRGCRGLDTAGIDTLDIDSSMRHAGNTAFKPDGSSIFLRGFDHVAPGKAREGLQASRMAGTRAILTSFVQEQALRLYPEIPLRFQCKLLDADLSARRLTFEDTTTHERFDVDADLVIAADGANSKVRRLMTQQVPGFKVDEHSNYTSMLGLQLPRLPGPDDLNSLGKPLAVAPEFAPGESWAGKGWIVSFFLPNNTKFPQGYISIYSHPTEGYSTVLGMPDTWWQAARSAESVRAHLLDRFPQLPKMCLDLFVQAASVPEPVLRPVPPSIKCSTIGIPGVILVGDAAHSVSPMYGQGTQTALEDSIYVTEAIEQAKGDISGLCHAYNASRRNDVHALIDLDRWFIDSSVDAPGSSAMKRLIKAPFTANALLCKWTARLPQPLRPLPFNARLNFGKQSFSEIKANTRRDVLVVALLLIAAASAVSLGFALLLDVAFRSVA